MGQGKAPCLFSLPYERGTNGKEAPHTCLFTLITTSSFRILQNMDDE